MVVQHNMQAANASRMLNITTGQQSKTTEKLSSGYRINRAADDAAGLSISEKMRRQIRGLSQASTNASDGVSAVQTAEGALNEVHSMLQRMNELAVQAANGSNSQSDRQDLQNEITQLTAEIDRISQTTRFNEGYLLKGMETKSKHYISAHDAGLPGYLKEIDGSEPAKTEFSLTDKPLKNGDTITIAGVNYEIGQTLTFNDYTNLTYAKTEMMSAGDRITTVSGSTYTLTNNVSEAEVLKDTARAGDRITDENGITYTYHVQTNTATPVYGDIDNAATGWYKDRDFVDEASAVALSAEEVIKIKSTGSIYTTAKDVEMSAGLKAAIAAGTVTGTALDAANAAFKNVSDAGVSHTIVKTLEKGEVSSFKVDDFSVDTVLKKAKGSTTGLEVGDKYSLNGTEKTVSDDKYTATNLADVKEAIEKLPSGTTIIIGDATGTLDTDVNPTASKTYIIIPDSEKSDLNYQAGKITRSQAIDLLKEGSRVDVQKTYTAADAHPTISGTYTGTGGTTAAGANKPITYTCGATGWVSNETTPSTIAMADYITFPGGVSIDCSNGYTYGDTITLTPSTATATGSATVTPTTPGSYTGTDTVKLTYKNTGVTATTGWYDEEGNYKGDNGAVTIGGIALAAGVDGDTVTLVPSSVTVTKAASPATTDIHLPTPVPTSYTVAGADVADEDAISVKTAYDKIATELKIASSIGTDEGARVVNNHDGTFTIEQGSVTYADPLIFDLHVGSEADMTNKIVVQLNSMNATSLGLNGVNIVDDTGMNATYVIDVISDALAKVSAQRAELGAVQNRLEHSIANLDNVVENTEASESRIRDTDMADAMVQYSKNNILAQAGQSMLAQANQATQGVLSLLQ